MARTPYRRRPPLIGSGSRQRSPWRVIVQSPDLAARALPRGATFGLAVVAGVAIALSLPPFGWWPLGLLGVAAWACLLTRPNVVGRAWAQAAIGAGVGVGQYSIGLWWATEFQAVGYVALVLMGIGFSAVAAALVPVRRRWAVTLALPAALVVTDWVRSNYPFGGLPIGAMALGQAGGPLAPSVRLGGALLLTGVIGLAGAGLAQLARAIPRPHRPGRWRPPEPAALARAAVALGLAAVAVVAGRLGPDGAASADGNGAPLRVAAVQGGGPRGLRAVEAGDTRVTQRQLDATSTLRPPIDLVLWPEDVVHVTQPVDQTPEGRAIAAAAKRLHTTLVAGVVTDTGDGRFGNQAVAWGPDGTIVAAFNKVHRVPFGEWIPGRGLIKHIADVSLVPSDAIAGHGPGLLLTPAAPLGVVISYEVFYDDRARAGIHAGGRVLLVPTNAASYTTSQVPTQEVAATRLRALETGRDTIQASPTGYSALVDHNGRVVARTALGRREVLVGTVEPRSGQTLFARFGDHPILVLAAAGLALGHVGRRRRR
jgi:apolipoprotein N-acyltransferase